MVMMSLAWGHARPIRLDCVLTHQLWKRCDYATHLSF